MHQHWTTHTAQLGWCFAKLADDGKTPLYRAGNAGEWVAFSAVKLGILRRASDDPASPTWQIHVALFPSPIEECAFLVWVLDEKGRPIYPHETTDVGPYSTAPGGASFRFAGELFSTPADRVTSPA